MAQRIKVTFVLEGVGTQMEVNPNAALIAALEHLFHERKITGRNPKEYEVTRENSTAKLSLHQSLSAQGVVDGEILYVNPVQGAAG